MAGKKFYGSLPADFFVLSVQPGAMQSQRMTHFAHWASYFFLHFSVKWCMICLVVVNKRLLSMQLKVYGSGTGHKLRKGLVFMGRKTGKSAALKIFGVISILAAAAYAILAVLALAGTVEGVLPGHEKAEILTVVLSFGVAILGLVCGVLCLRGKPGCSFFGLLFAILGLVSLIHVYMAQGSLNYFDLAAVVFGLCVFFLGKM